MARTGVREAGEETWDGTNTGSNGLRSPARRAETALAARRRSRNPYHTAACQLTSLLLSRLRQHQRQRRRHNNEVVHR